MTQAEAIDMISGGVPKGAAHWLDLGAGTGVFTEALATILGTDGTVYAIDRKLELPQRMNHSRHLARVIGTELDFVKDEIAIQQADGILLANSFHYVKDKEKLIAKLKGVLNPDGRFIFVEYDVVTSNQWVPYPIDFTSLRTLMTKMGFSSVSKISERPSVFNRAMMYSALVM